MTPPLLTPTGPLGESSMSTDIGTARPTGRAAAQRARFLDDAVATASPARLVTMLYDRLLLDLGRGGDAQLVGDRDAAHSHLLHAQEIVLELAGSLRQEHWSGAAALSSVYAFLHAELVRANVSGDPGRTASVRALVEPLAEAWRAAAVEIAAASAPVDRAG
jgi:flagellar protein FliS